MNASGPPIGNIFSPFSERIAEIERSAPMTERTRRNLSRALALIDPGERAAFLERHREHDPAEFRWLKYADFVYWTHRNVLQAERLDLDRSPPLNLWDIGTGSGSFPMVAKSMGHRVIGTDIAKDWGAELCELAGVERVNAAVRRGEPYRPVEGRFDLISIMMPNFHRRVVGGVFHYWSVEDWRSLLNGLSEQSLTDGGRILILMPPDRVDGGYARSRLVDWAIDAGADVQLDANGLHAAQIVLDRFPI